MWIVFNLSNILESWIEQFMNWNNRNKIKSWVNKIINLAIIFNNCYLIINLCALFVGVSLILQRVIEVTIIGTIILISLQII
jgi:hypothetical protein